MAEMNPSLVVGVRFDKVGKIYHFEASQFPEVRAGNRVIVRTKRGKQIGEGVTMVTDGSELPPRKLKRIQWIASPRELMIQQEWQKKGLNALITCREKASRVVIKDVKFVEAEYNFDGSAYGLEYLSLLRGQKLRHLPLPEDGEGWKFGQLETGFTGWFPPLFVSEDF